MVDYHTFGDNYKFQFHKGTIRTSSSPYQGLRPRSFQFHKGTIRTISRLNAKTFCTYFNSIKVRLELVVAPKKVAETTISIP